MGFVSVNRDIGTIVAKKYGRYATRLYGMQVADRAKALADARIKEKQHTSYIFVTGGHAPQDTRVELSVPGRTGQDVALQTEVGFFNVRAGRHIPGKHILRDAIGG